MMGSANLPRRCRGSSSDIGGGGAFVQPCQPCSPHDDMMSSGHKHIERPFGSTSKRSLLVSLQGTTDFARRPTALALSRCTADARFSSRACWRSLPTSRAKLFRSMADNLSCDDKGLLRPKSIDTATRGGTYLYMAHDAPRSNSEAHVPGTCSSYRQQVKESPLPSRQTLLVPAGHGVRR